ncbi:MAG: hypothetical protein RIC84_06945 [Aggregatilineales bacterium]
MKVPARIVGFRWLVICWAVIIFFWLSREDSDVLGVVLLGIWGAMLFCGSWITRNLGGRHVSRSSAVGVCLLGGGVVGIMTGLITAGLMFFKNVRHAHIFPDYPFEMIGAILERVPIWGIAGALFGLAGGLMWIAIRPHHPLQSEDFSHSQTPEPPH